MLAKQHKIESLFEASYSPSSIRSKAFILRTQSLLYKNNRINGDRVYY
jgi:hypothetical protein